MRQKSMCKHDPAERTVRDIRRKTRKQYTAEEKLRSVVSGLRGEASIAAWCRRVLNAPPRGRRSSPTSLVSKLRLAQRNLDCCKRGEDGGTVRASGYD